MRALILIGLVGFSLASTSNEAFLSFNKQFGKFFKSAVEFDYRRGIFNENLEKMEEHNARYKAGEETWFMKIHEDMDLTSEEWRSKRLGGLPAYSKDTVFKNTRDERIAAELKTKTKENLFDWSAQGKVSSVKNQAQCGSCAAFSVIGAVESCFAINYDRMDDDLSEQHILDCAYNHFVADEYGNWGAFGCEGAWPNAYVDWLMAGEMNQEEDAYPYTSGHSGHHGHCKPKDDGYHTSEQVTGMWNVWYPAEDDMESLVQINPVSTSLLATDNWGGYGGGIMQDNLCCDAASDDNCVYNLNHAILVVGYGHDSATGLDYWLIKNSWGNRWGDHGYMKLKRGTGHCGVGSLHQTIPYC